MYLINCLIVLYLEHLNQAVCSFSPFSHVILEKEIRSCLQRRSLAFWIASRTVVGGECGGKKKKKGGVVYMRTG